MTDLMTPTYASNMRIIGHTDQGGGRADGVQIMVHKGHAYSRRTSSPKDFPSSTCATRPNRRR